MAAETVRQRMHERKGEGRDTALWRYLFNEVFDLKPTSHQTGSIRLAAGLMNAAP